MCDQKSPKDTENDQKSAFTTEALSTYYMCARVAAEQ